MHFTFFSKDPEHNFLVYAKIFSDMPNGFQFCNGVLRITPSIKSHDVPLMFPRQLDSAPDRFKFKWAFQNKVPSDCIYKNNMIWLFNIMWCSLIRNFHVSSCWLCVKFIENHLPRSWMQYFGHFGNISHWNSQNG